MKAAAAASVVLIALGVCLADAKNHKDPHWFLGRNTIVHLFEWKFANIAEECVNYLGPRGFGGVQISPVHENLLVKNRPWWERYQPVSYNISSRSGNEEDFRMMVEKCNQVGVRIYVDVVLNHMTGDYDPAVGVAGTPADPRNRSYPGVPYGPEDFHTPCEMNMSDPLSVRNCELVGLHDLNQERPRVRQIILGFLNKLIFLGVAGFRIDAAKHMMPSDLQHIYSGLDHLNEDYFSPGQKAFIYQEVIDLGEDSVTASEYMHMATVTEFLYGYKLSEVFRKNGSLASLVNWGPEWGMMAKSEDALVFIDNHDNQRGHGISGPGILTYKDGKIYRMAIAFMLAHPYGITRIMSSFAFNDTDAGPPVDGNGTISSPEFDKNGQCTNGWVCEHRWNQTMEMVLFKAFAGNEPIENWWTNGQQQIAFSRGNRGFIAFSLEEDLKQTLQTGLLVGTYCDVITGGLGVEGCAGKNITVNPDGTAEIDIPENDENGVIAIHINAVLPIRN